MARGNEKERPRGSGRRKGLVAALGLAALGWSDPLATDGARAPAAPEPLHPERLGPRLRRIDGRDFPDGVLALTWDDGPDARSLELARYLRQSNVPATFFVVRAWSDGISDEPGFGRDDHASGYERLDVLGALTALGHRVATHTKNHVLLADASAAVVAEQIAEGQQDLDPFVTNELRLFRAPGGAWSAESARAMSGPLLESMVGPIHWDIDAKDWDASLHCRAAPPASCEPGPTGEPRVRAEIVAARYVEAAAARRRGIVLLHDRVGDVGSGYALDLARHLVPALKERGFVFASPVLAFSAFARRGALPPGTDPGAVVIADLDGDRRADACAAAGTELVCARGAVRVDGTGLRKIAFEPAAPLLRLPDGAAAIEAGDLDGDGRADVCAESDGGIACALLGGGPPRFTTWSPARGILRLADIDGDGRADACVRDGSSPRIACATSTGRGFGRPRVWAAQPALERGAAALADVDGDGRADLCVGDAARVACALSNGAAFGRWTTWSEGAGPGAIELADLNGDRRADLCYRAADGASVRCALSDGRAFRAATDWAAHAGSAGLRLADLDGDGRADLCLRSRDLDCALAP